MTNDKEVPQTHNVADFTFTQLPNKDRSAWTEEVNGPGDIAVEEIKILVPKFIKDRLKIGKSGTPINMTRSVLRFLLKKHGLCALREERLISTWLDIPEVRNVFNKYDKGELDFTQAKETLALLP